MTSLEIRLFRTQLVDLINDSPLPMEVKRYVMNEVFEDVKKSSEIEIQNQYNELEKLMEEEEDEQSVPDLSEERSDTVL